MVWSSPQDHALYVGADQHPCSQGPKPWALHIFKHCQCTRWSSCYGPALKRSQQRRIPHASNDSILHSPCLWPLHSLLAAWASAPATLGTQSERGGQARAEPTLGQLQLFPLPCPGARPPPPGTLQAARPPPCHQAARPTGTACHAQLVNSTGGGDLGGQGALQPPIPMPSHMPAPSLQAWHREPCIGVGSPLPSFPSPSPGSACLSSLRPLGLAPHSTQGGGRQLQNCIERAVTSQPGSQGSVTCRGTHSIGRSTPPGTDLPGAPLKLRAPHQVPSCSGGTVALSNSTA